MDFKETNNLTTSKTLSSWVIDGMKNKKAQDITVIKLTKIKNAVADYFVICSGTSDTQIDAIADGIEENVHKHSKQNPWHREGKENRQWILLDYVDVVAHVFKTDVREYFNIENLWGDAEIEYIENPT